MLLEEYYGEDLLRLRHVESRLLECIHQYPKQECSDGVQPILYCKSRIKEPDSMISKLKQRGLPTDAGTALEKMHDAVGVRIVCSFVDDVYKIAHWLDGKTELEVLQVKDYIAYPKSNGYRSLHLIVRLADGQERDIAAEIQLRTIALDFWAALEHQMKYKKQIGHEKTIRDELKRCADEIASVDISMQTLREIIQDDLG